MDETELNLRRDLSWVAKQTRKFPRKYTQVAIKTFYGRLCSISLADRLIDVTQLALTWDGWPNGEKTCVDLRANLISTKVSASQRKCTQVLTQVLNLRLLVTPFGQGLKGTRRCGKYNGHYLLTILIISSPRLDPGKILSLCGNL